MHSSLFLIAFLILMKDSKIVTTVNLAIVPGAKICTKTETSTALTDGNKRQLAETIEHECTVRTIEVKFDGLFHVHAVIVYGGMQLVHGEIQFGGTITVFLYAGSTLLCGHHLKRQTVAFHAMRVNCAQVHVAAQQMSVYWIKRPIYVTEIEVLTLGPGESRKNAMIHVGCFGSLVNSSDISSSDFDSCVFLCSFNFYPLAGIKNGTCYCATGINKASEMNNPLEHCNITCPETDKYCGGSASFSLYLVQVQLPHFIGCANDVRHIDLINIPDMTVVKCLLMCDTSYFALLKNGNECGCINDSKSLSYTTLTFCTTPCHGDRDGYCGGDNRISVYGTCFTNNTSVLPCSKIFHCARSWDEYGVCQGGCQTGYIGEHCLERNLESKGANVCAFSEPCLDQAHSFCKYDDVSDSFTCECEDGYWKAAPYGDCEKNPVVQSSMSTSFSGALETSTRTLSEELTKSLTEISAESFTKILTNASALVSIKASTSKSELASAEIVTSKSAKPSMKSGEGGCVPDPCKNLSHSFCYHFIVKDSYECLCDEGYWLETGDDCEDIDECIFEACDIKTSVCNNLVGSFKCQCSHGYYSITADICRSNVTVAHTFRNFDKELYFIGGLLALIPIPIFLCYGCTIEKSDISSTPEG